MSMCVRANLSMRIRCCVVFYAPQLELQAQVQPITRSILKVELTITPDFEFSPDVHSAGCAVD